MKILPRTFNENKIKKEYARLAGIYNLWSRLTESKALNKCLDLAEIRNGEKILEVAAGTGIFFKKIVKLNPDGMNRGIDISPHMIRKAEKELSLLKSTNYALHQGNALKLEFEDNTFDLLFNNYMIDLMPQEYFETILHEFYRVLKPGGRVIITTFSFGTRRIHRFWIWIARNFPALLTGCRPVSLQKYLEKTGFEIVNSEHISQNTFPSEIINAKKPIIFQEFSS